MKVILSNKDKKRCALVYEVFYVIVLFTVVGNEQLLVIYTLHIINNELIRWDVIGLWHMCILINDCSVKSTYYVSGSY